MMIYKGAKALNYFSGSIKIVWKSIPSRKYKLFSSYSSREIVEIARLLVATICLPKDCI